MLDQYLKAANDWISARNYRVSNVGFIRSAEAAPWQPFLTLLNAALAAWLGPQVNAVRAAAPHKLITIGYSDPLLAALPANLALDIHAINRYPRDASPRQLDYQMIIASELQAAFPGKPMFLTEFGYATNELDPAQARHLRKRGLATRGGIGTGRRWQMDAVGSAAWAQSARAQLRAVRRAGPGQTQRIGAAGAGAAPDPQSRSARPAANQRQSERHDRLPLRGGDACFASGNGQAGDGGVRWEGRAGDSSWRIGRSRASCGCKRPRRAR